MAGDVNSEWWQSKTLLFGLLALGLLLLMFLLALVVWVLTEQTLPFLSEFIQGLLGLFGINSARNVVSDGVPKIIAARNGYSGPPQRPPDPMAPKS